MEAKGEEVVGEERWTRDTGEEVGVGYVAQREECVEHSSDRLDSSSSLPCVSENEKLDRKSERRSVKTVESEETNGRTVSSLSDIGSISPPSIHYQFSPSFPQYQCPLEIPHLYSESQSSLISQSFSALRYLCSTYPNWDGPVLDYGSVCELFVSLMIEKVEEDSRRRQAGQPSQDIDEFVMNFCDEHEDGDSTLYELLKAVRAGVYQSHFVSETIARVLNVFVSDPYPQRIAGVIPRLIKSLPEYARPSSEEWQGKLNLSHAVYLVEKVFVEEEEEGMDLIRRTRPVSLSLPDLTLFLISYKSRSLKPDSLFRQLAGDEDKASISSLAKALRSYLKLWSSKEEVEEALATLDATRKGVISRLAFTRSVSSRRYAMIAKLPEYRVDTFKFLSEFAEGCIRRRRETISRLAVVYRAAVGTKPLTRASMHALLEGLCLPGDTPPLPDSPIQYTFLDFVYIAEQRLLGPFKAVYPCKD